jgi:hypothetical protein
VTALILQIRHDMRVKPPRPSGRGFASRAYAPGKESGHFCIAPLDPALPGGGSALRQHFVRGKHAGQRALNSSLRKDFTQNQNVLSGDWA